MKHQKFGPPTQTGKEGTRTATDKIYNTYIEIKVSCIMEYQKKLMDTHTVYYQDYQEWAYIHQSLDKLEDVAVI